MEITINKNEIAGKIKPLHCINNAPSFDDEVLFETLTEAGIPYSRLHDTFELHYDRLVDVPNVFPISTRMKTTPRVTTLRLRTCL